ncbi:DIP1984 family protein [Gelidibacter sediminis]|uniref:DIP1984 family protein n=1 Tax=Gelidibacter sediminis TaxID=1608710 RepID=UPI003743546C
MLRADLTKKIEHLQTRIRPVLIVSDDRLPQEDPIKLLTQLRHTIAFGSFGHASIKPTIQPL